MKIQIDEKEISEAEIEGWENKRRLKTIKTLKNKFGLNLKNDCSNEELAAAKRSIPEEKIYSRLGNNIRLSNFVTRMMNGFCHGNRTSSVTEITLPGINAQKLQEEYFDIMLNNTEANRLLSLRANPDHYLLKGIENNKQEVIECTGGLNYQSHFIIEYGNENGLKSKQNPDYPYQACGVCCLTDGTPIGGVRHQMKDTETGAKIRLEVEFPSNLPKSVLQQHQLHLACEFKNWFGEILTRNSKDE